MSRPCPVCGQPVTDQGTVCHGCWDRTVGALATLHGLLPELDITITGQARMPFGSKGAGGVGYDQRAAALRDDIRASLVGWCRLLHEDQGVPYPHDTIVDMAHTVALSDLRMHEAAAEAVAEITAWPALIRKAIDWPEERKVTRVARCTRAGEGWACEGWLHVHYPMQGPPYVSCHDCGSMWTTLEQMGQLQGEIVTRALDERHRRR